MYKGDISNDMPKRVLVNADILFLKSTTITKKFKFIPVKDVQVVYDRFLLNKFYVYTTRAGVTLELVSFEFDYEEMELLFNDIDRVGTNPFKYFSSYDSPKKLVADLPYRPEVVGVVDPAHQLMYGRLGMDF
jgi:hypothetical protein